MFGKFNLYLFILLFVSISLAFPQRGEIGIYKDLLKKLPTQYLSIEAGMFSLGGSFGGTVNLILPNFGNIPIYLDLKIGSIGEPSFFERSVERGFIEVPLIGGSGLFYKLGLGIKLTEQKLIDDFRLVVDFEKTGEFPGGYYNRYSSGSTITTTSYYNITGPALASKILLVEFAMEASGNNWQFVSNTFNTYNYLINQPVYYIIPKLRFQKLWNFEYNVIMQGEYINPGDKRIFREWRTIDIGFVMDITFNQFGAVFEYSNRKKYLDFRIGIGLIKRLKVPNYIKDNDPPAFVDSWYLPFYVTFGFGGPIPITKSDKKWWTF